jgi:hypothetical protein
MAELERILWRDARAKDPARRGKAVEILHRIETSKRERETIEPSADALNAIAERSPLLALWLSCSHRFNGSLSPMYRPKALSELEEVRQWILRDGNPAFTIGPPSANETHASTASSESVGPAAP